MRLKQLRRPVFLSFCLLIVGPAGRADTVASLLGDFTINQFCGLRLSRDAVAVHYAVVYGQLPALRELHSADANGDGVTSQSERDAYVGTLAPGFANGLKLIVDDVQVPLHATYWTSSLPSEQGGFSLRLDVDFSAALPVAGAAGTRTLQLSNDNYPGRIGWHEIVVNPVPGVAVFDTDAYANSVTGGLTEALQALPEAGPLDERSVHLSFAEGGAFPGKRALGHRPSAAAPTLKSDANPPGAWAKNAADGADSTWIAIKTRQLVQSISGPRLEPSIALGALFAALLLGAVHALSPGHGKTLVGAYLIGSRGTPRHAVFLGLTVTVTHTIGVFALGFATLYASRFVAPERLFPVLSLISAVLVLGMGIVLLVQRGRAAGRAQGGVELVFRPMQAAAHGLGAHGSVLLSRHQYLPVHGQADATLHSHGGGKPHSHLPPGADGGRVSWRSLLALGISGGLVPCPSALVLLLAAIALNKTAYGMLLVLVFSVGLAVTLTVVGLLFLYARNRLRRPKATAGWLQWLPVLSAGTITVVGVALCIGALKSFN